MMCRVTEWQLHELESAYERERGIMQELLAKHEAVCRCSLRMLSCCEVFATAP